MIKNQLVIYRTFATQQYIFQKQKITNILQIPVSPSTKYSEIISNHPFSLSKTQDSSYIIIDPIPDTTHHIHEISESEVEKLNLDDVIEIIIKYPSIHWKSHYTFFKNNSTFIYNIVIHNESKISFDTNDIKLIFRSIDHKYEPKNSDLSTKSCSQDEFLDIPTLQTSNLIEYDLKPKLDDHFVLKEYYHTQFWNNSVNHSEIYQVDIFDEYQKFSNSFITFKVPEIILPGHLELYDRTESNDIYSIGSLDIKLYHKDNKMKILFPKNKMLKLKNSLTKKSHSFFITKTHYIFESKMKKLFPIRTIVHFYIYSKTEIKNLSKPFTYHEDHHYIWEHICDKDKDVFTLEFDSES